MLSLYSTYDGLKQMALDTLANLSVEVMWQNFWLEIEKKPYHFVAQEHISFSTTPNYSKGNFEPRNMVARTFTMAGKTGYNVMPGGLVRVAPERDNIRVSNQRGGTSKDCVSYSAGRSTSTSAASSLESHVILVLKR